MCECSEKPLTKFWLMCLMCFRLWPFEGAASNYSSRFSVFCGFCLYEQVIEKLLHQFRNLEKQTIHNMSTHCRDEFMVFLMLSYDFLKNRKVRLFPKTAKTWTVQVGLWPFEGEASNYSSVLLRFLLVLMNLWCLQSTIWHFFEIPQKIVIFSKYRKDLDWALGFRGERGVARLHFVCGICPYAARVSCWQLGFG